MEDQTIKIFRLGFKKTVYAAFFAIVGIFLLGFLIFVSYQKYEDVTEKFKTESAIIINTFLSFSEDLEHHLEEIRDAFQATRSTDFDSIDPQLYQSLFQLSDSGKILELFKIYPSFSIHFNESRVLLKFFEEDFSEIGLEHVFLHHRSTQKVIFYHKLNPEADPVDIPALNLSIESNVFFSNGLFWILYPLDKNFYLHLGFKKNFLKKILQDKAALLKYDLPSSIMFILDNGEVFADLGNALFQPSSEKQLDNIPDATLKFIQNTEDGSSWHNLSIYEQSYPAMFQKLEFFNRSCSFMIITSYANLLYLIIKNSLYNFLGVILISILLVFLVIFFTNRVVDFISAIEQSFSSAIQDNRNYIQNLAENSQDISDSGLKVSSAVQQTAATLNQITQMVQRTVSSVQDANEQAFQNQDISKVGQESVAQMIKAMQDIFHGNQAIFDEIQKNQQDFENIVNLIQDISRKTNIINDIVFQTKILSFNASVEAARAGIHGRGFSVVAEEVGQLAENSGAAAREIMEIVDRSVNEVIQVVSQTSSKVEALRNSAQDNVDHGLIVAKRCNEILEQIVKNSEKVSVSLNHIREAMQEQSDGVNNISQAMFNIQNVIQTNNQTTSSISNVLENLKSTVHQLEQSFRSLQFFLQGSTVSSSSEDTLFFSSFDNQPTRKYESQSETSHEASTFNSLTKNTVPSRQDEEFEEF